MQLKMAGKEPPPIVTTFNPVNHHPFQVGPTGTCVHEMAEKSYS